MHVAHAIIDGVIDLERTKGFGSNEPDAKLKPEAVSVGSFFLSVSLFVFVLDTFNPGYFLDHGSPRLRGTRIKKAKRRKARY